MNLKMKELFIKYHVTSKELAGEIVPPPFLKFLSIIKDKNSGEFTYRCWRRKQADFYDDDLPANENTNNRIHIEMDNYHDSLVVGYRLCRMISNLLSKRKETFHVFMNFTDDGHDCVKVSFYCSRKGYMDILSPLDSYLNEGICLFEVNGIAL